MTHLGVYCVGEVDRRGTPGQGDDVSARRENVGFRGAEVVAQAVEELVGVVHLTLPLEDLAQPAEVIGTMLARDVRLLVAPVRRHAVLGRPVHVVGADLHLHRLTLRADHGRVQRLVHRELGHGDVVLEPARHRVEPGVQDPQDRVAITDRLDQDAHTYEVVDVGEIAAPHDHLLVDRVVVLGSSGDDRLDACTAQVVLDHRQHPLQVLLPTRGTLADEPLQLREHLWVQGGEGKVLQLPLDGVHSETVRQRCVDLERLARFRRLLLGRHGPQRSHVVQTVGEFDHQDPDIAGHGDDHLADRLRGAGGAVLDLVQLGDTVDQRGHLIAEVRGERLQRVVGVLDGVVEQRCGNGWRRHAQFGKDLGDGHGMSDVRLTATAPLVSVVVGRGLEGPFQ